MVFLFLKGGGLIELIVHINESETCIYVSNTYKTSVSKVKIKGQRLRSRVKVKYHTLKKRGGGLYFEYVCEINETQKGITARRDVRPFWNKRLKKLLPKTLVKVSNLYL